MALQCFLVYEHNQVPLNLIRKPGLDCWCRYASKEHEMPVLPKSAVLAGLLVQGRDSSSGLCWELRLVHSLSAAITRKLHLLKPLIKHLNQALVGLLLLPVLLTQGRGSVLLHLGTALEES